MLPQKLDLPQMQTKWASQLNPVISNLLVQGQLLQDVSLINGVTVVNHKLGRKLIGWFIVGQDAQASLWDSQTSNQTPQLTLVLNSNADVNCSIWVF